MLEIYGRHPTTATAEIPDRRHCHWRDRRSPSGRTCVCHAQTVPCPGSGDDDLDDSSDPVNTDACSGAERSGTTSRDTDIHPFHSRSDIHSPGAARRVTRAASLSFGRHGAIFLEQRLSIRGSKRSETSVRHHGRRIHGFALPAGRGLRVARRTWCATSCDRHTIRTNAGRDARYGPCKNSFSPRTSFHAPRH